MQKNFVHIPSGVHLEEYGMTPIDLLHQCAPDIAPVTIAAIVQHESGGNPYALHDNTTGKSLHPTTAPSAARLAHTLIAAGHSVDLGLAQINSKNLHTLGLQIDDLLDPCTNLHAAQTILKNTWLQSGQNLRNTLAIYNTGKTLTAAGIRYSADVYAQAEVTVPSIPGGKMAKWTISPAWTPSTLPPIQPLVKWQPSTSPLQPNAIGLTPKSGVLNKISTP